MIKFVLSDIEGTTTSISFVHQVLFPFSKEKIESWIKSQSESPEVKPLVQSILKTCDEEGKPIESQDVGQKLVQWIEEDRKHPALKTIQGMIWVSGYESGDLKGHLYPDVKPILDKWKSEGIGLGIYSSGSVKAQKLLFGYSVEGDLNHLFSAYFDTSVGHKREPQSYKNISEKLGIKSNEILFLSDIVEELDAAKESGLKTLQLVRPEEKVVTGNHQTVNSFEQIDLSNLN